MNDDTGTAGTDSAAYLHTGESGLDEEERRASRKSRRGGSRGGEAARPIQVDDDDISVGTAASQPGFSPERSAVSRISITSVTRDG